MKYRQDETLKRAYSILAKFGITRHSCMDSCLFDRTVIPVVEENSEYFFIRAQRCESLYQHIKQIDKLAVFGNRL